MAIHILTGLPRHGKTYRLAQIGTDLLLHGERVFSNFKFNLGTGTLKKITPDIVGDLANETDFNSPEKRLFYWNNMHEWEHMGQGNILCDEMQRYFNARRWEQLSEDTELKLQQHGKDNLDIYGTTQHYSRIDVALRQLVETWTDVETIFGNPDNKKPFLGIKIIKYVTIQGIEYFEPYERMKIDPRLELDIPMQKRIRLFRKKHAIVYDTLEKIGRSEPMPLVHKVRICKQCGKAITSHA